MFEWQRHAPQSSPITQFLRCLQSKHGKILDRKIVPTCYRRRHSRSKLHDQWPLWASKDMLVPQKSKGPQRWCHLGKSLVFSKRSIHLGVPSYLGNCCVVLHRQVPVFQCEAFATAVWKDDRILQKVCRRGGGTQIIVILDKTCLTPEVWMESFLLKVFTCYTLYILGEVVSQFCTTSQTNMYSNSNRHADGLITFYVAWCWFFAESRSHCCWLWTPGWKRETTKNGQGFRWSYYIYIYIVEVLLWL